MQGKLQKWLLLSLLLTLLSVAFPANAQGQVSLETLTVQLWPEFDQPAMLVIYDFTLPTSTSLPINVKLRIPKDANLTAVAYAPPGSDLLNAPSEAPYSEGEWQVITINVDTVATYHIEYYASLSFDDTEREYSYLWPGDYVVNSFNLSLKIPVDTTEISTDPPMKQTSSEGSTQTYLTWQTSDVQADEEIPFAIKYKKTSNRLSMSEQPLETAAVDENTQGRVSLSNYLPYILGGLGMLLIFAGGLYFWQTSQGKPEPRKRHSRRSDEEPGEDIYCHQCGNRAQASDRFCRTCGTRLRRET